MLVESILAMLAAIARVTGSERALSPAQFTYAFATDSVRFEFADVPKPFWIEPREQPGVRPTAGGLELDAKSDAPTVCLLRPWHLDGTHELFISWNASVPVDAGLRIDARLLEHSTSPARPEDASEWVCVGRVGRFPADVASETASSNPRIEACDGYFEFGDAREYVQLRVITCGSRDAGGPVILERVNIAGSNRDRVGTRESSLSGGCGLGSDLLKEREREAHEQSHRPHPLPFVAAGPSETISLEQSTGIACLRMMLTVQSSRDELETRIAGCAPIASRSLPSWLAATAHACGVRSELECASLRREAEALLHGNRPFAMRIVDEHGRLTWAVLTSFGEHDAAVVYDPTTSTREPRHWSWDELERRWFGAGGLALRIEG